MIEQCMNKRHRIQPAGILQKKSRTGRYHTAQMRGCRADDFRNLAVQARRCVGSQLVMTPLIARHPKCPAKCVRHLSAMSGEPVTQPVHAGGRKFGNRVIGATWLGPNHSHRVTGSAAGRLLSLQHSD
jgi:hypothetical protein